MPLPLPLLDRLTYDELVAEGRSSLPAAAPQWTDHNAHDPGITLLELFAWLAEKDSYRLDRIPDEWYRAFLRLVGVIPRPAQAAQVQLVCRTGASAQLPAGTLVQSADGKTIFQTTAGLHISTARLKVLLCGAADRLVDQTVRNLASGAGFFPLGEAPKLGDALYLGFDRVLAPEDTELSLWVWTGNEVEDSKTRAQLQQEYDEAKAEKSNLCPSSAVDHMLPWQQHYGVRMVWEYYAGQTRWIQLKDVEDETRALTLSGAVRFKAPGNHAAGLPGSTAHRSILFIRCRLAHGRYDCPPRCVAVAFNVLPAQQAVDALPQTFRSTGGGAQCFGLAGTPVLPGSTKVTISPVGAAPETWEETLTWEGSGPHHRHYVLAPETGTIAFGDGRVGRVPPADAEIVVQYQTGGGVSGNIPALMLTQVPSGPPGLTVTQPVAAIGGSATETLNEAKARVLREFAMPTRAVTLDDFVRLALSTAGVPVARAYAIADYHPAMSCIPVSGCVTVVVLPPCPDSQPMPTDALLTAVKRYLDRRRVLTTELHVVAPQYSVVSVRARLHGRPGTDARTLVRDAKAALEGYFHPLRGGPEGQGWPAGRSVYRSELLALLNEVNGVSYVDDLTWTVEGQAVSRCETIALCRHGLVASGRHDISVNEGKACHE